MFVGPNNTIHAWGVYTSLTSGIYTLAVFFKTIYSQKFRLDEDLEKQYYVGVISGLVSGLILLAAQELLLNLSDPTSSILRSVFFIGLMMLFISFGALAMGSYIQNRE
ncbi:hypothetical protein [Geoglobus sp.]